MPIPTGTKVRLEHFTTAWNALKAVMAILFVLLVACIGDTPSISGPSSAVRHFLRVHQSRFPRTVLERDFCEDREPARCWSGFEHTGGVWTADINGDGIDELLVAPGVLSAGSNGRWYYLYQKREKDWRSIAETGWGDDQTDGWQTLRPRFDVLPTVRNGYHDLRITVDQCVKWNVDKYIEYSLEDYRVLSTEWFNASDSREAEIFWTIRYGGPDTFTFKPQWFPVSPNEFLQRTNFTRDMARFIRSPAADFPRVPDEVLDDPMQNLKWVGLEKRGVWGIRGRRGFLLCPRVGYSGPGMLKFDGDWLLVFEASDADPPVLRYNRRTDELQMDPNHRGLVLPAGSHGQGDAGQASSRGS